MSAPRRSLNKGDLLACAIGFLGITAGAVFFMTVPISREGPVLCTFKRLTSLGCPGCGLTRSIGATAHLQLGEAFRWHLLGPPVVAGLVVLWSLLALSLVTRKAWYPDPNARWLALTVLSAGGLTIVYWVVRLALHSVP